MKKISDKDWTRITEGHTALFTIKVELEEYMQSVHAELEKFSERLEMVREDIHGHLDDLVNQAQSYYDERSDKWTESDTGQQYQDWISELESARDELENSLALEIDEYDLIAPIEATLEFLDGGIKQSPDD